MPAENSKEIVVFAETFIREEHIENAMRLFSELVEKTKKENGCIVYELYNDESDKTHFIFFEKWESEWHLAEHMKSGHFLEIVPKLGEMSSKDGIVVTSCKIF